jgi:hypothetical protein
MKYKELLNKYRNGALSPEEAAQVEMDLEKHEAIMDHLLQNMEADAAQTASLPDKSADLTPDSEQDFLRTVNGAIRRSFLIAGAVIAAVAIAVVLAVVLVLPSAVSSFYYDPNECMGVDKYNIETTRMSLDLSVFTELFLPGRYRDTVYAEANGYGEYDIIIPQTVSHSGTFTNTAGRLERGELRLYDPNLLKFPTGNAFVLPEEIDFGFHGAGPAGSAENALAKLNTLDTHKVYLAYFSLDKLTPYEEFIWWYLDMQIAADPWCAVYAHPSTSDTIGFSPATSGIILSWDVEAYPYLSMLGQNSSTESIEAAITNAQLMQTHFTSMLRYLNDNPKITKMMHLTAENIDYSQMIQSIERGGLRLYGFAIGAQKEALLELRKDPSVSYIYTTVLY